MTFGWSKLKNWHSGIIMGSSAKDWEKPLTEEPEMNEIIRLSVPEVLLGTLFYRSPSQNL